MKLTHRISITVLLTFSAVAAASAQEAPEEAVLRTSAVGVVQLTIPAGQGRAISIPLHNPAIFSGKIGELSDSTLVPEGGLPEGFSAGPWASAPHVLRTLSGPAQGHPIPITEVSQGQLILDLGSGEIAPAVGDQFEIYPIDTVGSFFGGPEEGIFPNTDPKKADNLVIHLENGWVTLFHDGVTWREDGAEDYDASSYPLLPDHGTLFIRRGRPALRITLAGELPDSPAAIVAPASSIQFLANPFASSVRLARLGLQDDPAWISSRDSEQADLVHLYTRRGWRSFHHDGRFWRNQNGRRLNPRIRRGAAILVERRPGETVAIAPEPPYPFPASDASSSN